MVQQRLLLNRRRFLRGTVTALSVGAWATLGGCALRPDGSGPDRVILSAADDLDGHHAIAGVRPDGELLFSTPVPERCHGGCARPANTRKSDRESARVESTEVVMFARRPGFHFYVVDVPAGRVLHTVSAGEGHHFYGHGVFSRDGRYLYATTNHYHTGEGMVAVFDARRDYTRVARYSTGGIGPHEIRLHPDGDTLVIGLGGIKTHPDYGRIKLNLDSMQPALLLMDRHNGQITGRFAPSHHQLSCRHLDVGRDGIVVAGYQFQGPATESPPLIALLDTRSGRFQEIGLPMQLQQSLRNYTASVALSPTLPRFAVTAPRGNRVVVYDYAEERLVQAAEVVDCAGVLGDLEGGFRVSSGRGDLFRLPKSGDAVSRLASHPLHWDNHLTLAG